MAPSISGTVPATLEIAALNFQNIGIIGAGHMGSGIALACATVGPSVTMIDAAVERGVATLRGSLDRLIEKDRLTAAEKEAAIAPVVSTYGKDPSPALAGSLPLLELFGIVAGGWQMGCAALASHLHLQEGTGDAAFYRAKLTAALFCGSRTDPHCRVGARGGAGCRRGAGNLRRRVVTRYLSSAAPSTLSPHH